MKPFSIDTTDETLLNILREQAKRQPDWALNAPAKTEGELVINPYELGLKFPLRLGALIDKINYGLSGRTRFAPVDTKMTWGDYALEEDGVHFTHIPSGQKLALTDKEYLMVRGLIEQGDQGAPRGYLLHHVWGYADNVETHTVETHIYRLRQKLEHVFGNAVEIINADGHYRIRQNG